MQWFLNTWTDLLCGTFRVIFRTISDIWMELFVSQNEMGGKVVNTPLTLLQLVVRLLLTLLYLVASLIFLYVMLCMIWYLLYNLKNVKHTHGGVLLLVINTLPWVFFTLFKLHKWYGIGRSVSYFDKLQQTSCSIHTLKPQNMFNNWMKFRPKAFCRPGLRWRVKKRICCLNLFHGMFHLPSGLSESHFILKEF